GVIDEVFIPLHGEHQADNAAIALAAVEAFFDRPLDADLVREAFATVRVPGRFEIVQREPTVVLDAAHNVDGAAACQRTLAEEFTLTGSLIMVVGLLDGRDPEDYLDALGARDAGFLVACSPESPRAIPASRLAAVAEGMSIVAESERSVEDAVHRALAIASPDDLVLITGSLYVVGPARTLLQTEVDA
ncbi:MAG TPA: cyanophycin synthetase, partial [Acidimicrobiales bacterium]